MHTLGMRNWRKGGMENLVREDEFRKHGKLAMAYILLQPYGRLYQPKEGWRRGTLFPDLYSPYPY
jgi:hypothetical protein